MKKIYSHTTVLLNEAIQALNIRPNGIYLDGTFGRGGHSRLILSQLNMHGRLFAIDCDLSAIKAAQTIEDTRFIIIHGQFSSMLQYMTRFNLKDKVDGILLDLGVSSPQLEDPKRGFSFMHDGPLDMRMDTTRGQTAAQWLARSSVDDITWVLKNFGEERFAKRIAQAIISYNNKRLITRTNELVSLIANAIPFRCKHKHLATRSFQAIRMFINNELEEIKLALHGALKLLAPKGKLLVISFHSLEDRLVKHFFRQYSCKPQIPLGMPLTEKQIIIQYEDQRKLKIIKKIQPTALEVSNNPRARSAILRIAEKIKL